MSSERKRSEASSGREAFTVRTPSRRELLRCASLGFGSLACAALVSDELRRGVGAFERVADSDGRPVTHVAPRARSVIFLYMDGGVSQVDSFDPKPRLTAENGRPFAMPMEPTQFEQNGLTLGSPWSFSRYGESGLEVSELFPETGRLADRLCVVRSMTSKFSEHNAANYFLHSGAGMSGRPSMGSWATYGLASATADLPGYVVLDGGLIPSGGVECFGAGFLPAAHQASLLQNRNPALANIRSSESVPGLQEHKLAALRRPNAELAARSGGDEAIEGAIRNYELAFRMQRTIPEATDISDESPETGRLYGLETDYEPTRNYGRQCLVARRLVERGVRFIELTCPKSHGAGRWDAHLDLRKNHAANARSIDRPIAGLLTDLERRGLLDETLVVWSGEFGRTPFAQGADGRDHNPFGFTCWLAGGGVRGGMAYGATDELGYKAIENPLDIHDLHATMLHLLGLDHERLTYRFGGRDYRLTDVHGRVIRELLA
ncbi:MAG TPA: DUF1501 domain-containing protein [Planctomycetaceae bacterium]|nr:DUF1501 domain-containing protein [Planctomycetaceae bacterium]